MEQSGNLIDDGLVPEDKELSVFDPHVLPKESVFAEITASHTAQEDTVNAIGDGEVDEWSSGNQVSRWTSRGKPGEEQWVIGQFDRLRSLRSVGVFWMDRWQGDVRLPEEWTEVENGRYKPFDFIQPIGMYASISSM